LELRKQSIDSRIVLQIDPGKRDSVVREEVANAMRVARIARAHHSHAGSAGLPEQLPAHEKCPQQDIAQARHLT
jgi:hypothetical protein